MYQRGASIASCGSAPSSIRCARSCTWICACESPPMVPNTTRARRRASPWPASECASGASRARARSRVVGSSVNDEPRLLRLIPHSGTCTPEPNDKKFDWMRLTSKPSASAAQRYAVPPTCAAPGAGVVARCGSMRERRSVDPAVREHLRGRDRHGVRIGDVLVAVLERELGGLDQEVVAVGPVGGQREAVQDAQRLERGDALCRRRQLGDLDVAVRRAERRVPIVPRARRGRSAVSSPPCAWTVSAIASAIGSAVVRVGAVGGEGLDRARPARVAGATPPPRRLRTRRATRRNPSYSASDPPMIHRAHRRELESVAGVAERGLAPARRTTCVPHRSRRSNQPATPPGTVTECGPSTGIVSDSARSRTVVDRRRLRRPARAEISVQLAVPDDREDVAAVTAQVRRHDSEREVGGDRGVECVSAAGQGRQPGGRREVVRTRDATPGEAPRRHGGRLPEQRESVG